MEPEKKKELKTPWNSPIEEDLTKVIHVAVHWSDLRRGINMIGPLNEHRCMHLLHWLNLGNELEVDTRLCYSINRRDRNRNRIYVEGIPMKYIEGEEFVFDDTRLHPEYEDQVGYINHHNFHVILDDKHTDMDEENRKMLLNNMSDWEKETLGLK